MVKIGMLLLWKRIINWASLWSHSIILENFYDVLILHYLIMDDIKISNPDVFLQKVTQN